ncbi:MULTISPECIES: cation transporting ATPase C-terminal domain-containing protein [Halomonas]|uniref:cation transporting ATPase C-terminal domain-containing protein n=1 Tax=Halomonas TaxID=2745 RepID=UPI0018674ED6|nr:cation transporting ATPase C-terminal domain-containing protein [Halomonas citrativorans]
MTTTVINAMVVMEIFYLFKIRYLHASSFSFVGMKRTPVVLAAIGVVVLAQLAFTYLPAGAQPFCKRADFDCRCCW